MKVSEGPVYSHNTGHIIGFTSLGSLSDEFELYTRMCKGEKKQAVASHVLTLMIRAISEFGVIDWSIMTSSCHRSIVHRRQPALRVRSHALAAHAV